MIFTFNENGVVFFVAITVDSLDLDPPTRASLPRFPDFGVVDAPAVDVAYLAYLCAIVAPRLLRGIQGEKALKEPDAVVFRAGFRLPSFRRTSLFRGVP